MTHFTVVLDTVPADRTETYGVLYQSRNVYKTVKSHAPTRVVVWGNLNRPNPDRGKKLGDTLTVGDRRGNIVTRYSLRYTEGRWLDPHNEPTDETVSVLLSTESSAICAHTSMNTGQPGSGQVYADAPPMRDEDTAVLVYPGGGTRSVTLHLPPHHNGHGTATFS